MLIKYPGPTVVGGLGMAVAIATAAIFDASVGAANSPMPIEGGDRIVALEVWDTEINNQEGQFLYDYGTWEEGLRSIESLGAYRATSRNLIVPGGSTEPVQLAEMTASGFGIVGVPPLLGRPLVEGDAGAAHPREHLVARGAVSGSSGWRRCEKNRRSRATHLRTNRGCRSDRLPRTGSRRPTCGLSR